MYHNSLFPFNKTLANRPRSGLLLVSLVLLFILPLFPCVSHGKSARIDILMWHETIHDEEALTGFLEGMTLSNINYTINLQRAHGNEEEARRILQGLHSSQTDLLITISTRGTQLALEETQQIPILFTAVSDPINNGIIKSWQSPGNTISGSSNWIKAGEMVRFFRDTIPNCKRLGVIYNPSNPASHMEVTQMITPAMEAGITLNIEKVSTLHAITDAVARLKNASIDGFWIPRDKLLYTHMDTISPLLQQLGVPVVSSTREALLSENSVAIAALVADYRKLGRQLIPAVVAILNGSRQPGSIPVVLPANYRLIINANAIKILGHPLPFQYAALADEIITGYQGQQITIDGSGDPQELLSTLALNLEKELNGGRILIPNSIGSTGGIKKVMDKTIPLARIARPLKDEERAAGITAIPFAQSPIVFVVHKQTTGIDNLNFEQLVGIYRGRYKNWKQVGGNDAPIYPVTREEGDSSLRVLTDIIPSFPKTSPCAKVVFTTPKMHTTTLRYANTIGFLPHSMVTDPSLTILKINGYTPSPKNILAGYYPLFVTFSIAYKDQPQGLANRFLSFIFSNAGQNILRQEMTVPLARP